MLHIRGAYECTMKWNGRRVMEGMDKVPRFKWSGVPSQAFRAPGRTGRGKRELNLYCAPVHILATSKCVLHNYASTKIAGNDFGCSLESSFPPAGMHADVRLYASQVLSFTAVSCNSAREREVS